eukprot:scaffold297700_cov21-Prasinocladus_malaysianus.AAC.1
MFGRSHCSENTSSCAHPSIHVSASADNICPSPATNARPARTRMSTWTGKKDWHFDEEAKKLSYEDS